MDAEQQRAELDFPQLGNFGEPLFDEDVERNLEQQVESGFGDAKNDLRELGRVVAFVGDALDFQTQGLASPLRKEK